MTSEIELELTDTGRVALGETVAYAKEATDLSDEVQETAKWLHTEVWQEGPLYFGDQLATHLCEICEWGENNNPKYAEHLKQIKQAIITEQNK